MALISELRIGDTAKVVSFNKDARAYRERLMALGLTPGVSFVLRRLAPLGDPIELSVRGFSLSLRKKEADMIIIEQVKA